MWCLILFLLTLSRFQQGYGWDRGTVADWRGGFDGLLAQLDFLAGRSPAKSDAFRQIH